MWVIYWEHSCSRAPLNSACKEASAKKRLQTRTLHSKVGVFAGEGGGEDIQRVQTPVPAVAAADRPSRPCVTEQETESPGGPRCRPGWEVLLWRIFSSRLLQWESHDRFSRGPWGDRTVTGAPDLEAARKQLLLREPSTPKPLPSSPFTFALFSRHRITLTSALK